MATRETFRSILVLVDRGRSAVARIAAAARLAAAWDAPLTGAYLCASPSLHDPGVEGVVAPVIAAQAAFAENVAEAKEDVAEVRAEFETGAREADVEAHWLDLEEEEGLMACARHYDLIVMPRRLRTGSGHTLAAETVALSCGGPVLILPESAYPVAFGRKVLVAWKDSREAARAVRDAWPFLSRAEEIHFVTAAREGERRLDSLVQQHLLAHGCNPARLTLDRDSDRPAGEIIRQHVDILGADLIVMGLFGHSRFKEFVLGGVSQYLLDHSSMPLLVSH